MSNGSFINTSILDGLPTTDDETRWAAVLRETEDLRMQLEDIKQQLALRETSINELYDVDVGNPTDDQVLTWDASTSTWRPGNADSVPGGSIDFGGSTHNQYGEITFTVDLDVAATINQYSEYEETSGAPVQDVCGKVDIAWAFNKYDSTSYRVAAASSAVSYTTSNSVDPVFRTYASAGENSFVADGNFYQIDSFDAGYFAVHNPILVILYAKLDGTSLTLRADFANNGYTPHESSVFTFFQPNAT